MTQDNLSNRASISRGVTRAMAWLPVLLAATLPLTLLTVAPASAVTHPANCTGTVVDQRVRNTITTPHVPILELDLYWDSARGTNCAKALHLGPSIGQAVPTSVVIWECAQTVPSPVCDAIALDTDRGAHYAHFAGAVSVPGRGHCVYSDGSIDWKGHHYSIDTIDMNGNLATHCG
jgi:hypothetical protein